MRRLRRVRTSTWVVLAIFLVALAAYLLVRPEPAATSDNPGPTSPKVSHTVVPSTARPTPTPRPTRSRTPVSRPSRTATPEPSAVPTVSPSVGTTAPTATPSAAPS